MDKRKGFTLIELLVVIAIVALLMSILMPALTRVRKQAKSSVCQMNLRHWGLVFSMYTDDNDGHFNAGWYMGVDESPEVSFAGGHHWPVTLLSYYSDPKLRFCPMATRSYAQGAPVRFMAWIAPEPMTADSEEFIPCGSYGFNEWCGNPPSWVQQVEWRMLTDRWRTPNVRGAHNVPLLMDAWWTGGFPRDTDSPPAFDGDIDGGEMGRFCVNRHNLAVNSVFVDWSVRKVGLKQLWTLKWHRSWDLANCPDQDNPEDWPDWMKNAKNYE